MSRIQFVNSNISGFSKGSIEAKNLEEIRKLIEDEGWSAEVFYDFEAEKWTVYCFKYSNRLQTYLERDDKKPYEFKKYQFSKTLIAPYLGTASLIDRWDNIQHIGKEWVRVLSDYITGKVMLVRRH